MQAGRRGNMGASETVISRFTIAETRTCRSEPLGEQSLVFLFYHHVTFTGALLQPASIKHRDVSASVANQTIILQPECDCRHALSAYAEDSGHEFVSHQDVTGLPMIEAYQQPSAYLLFYRVVTIADGVLRRLRDQYLRITKQQVHQSSRAVEFSFYNLRFNPK
jgi:hypothetical protein